MRGEFGLPREMTRGDPDGTARDPKTRSLLEVQMQIGRVSSAFSDAIRIDRAKEGCNRKNKEISAEEEASDTQNGSANRNRALRVLRKLT